MDEEVLEQVIFKCPAGFKRKRKRVSKLLFHTDSYGALPCFFSAFLAL